MFATFILARLLLPDLPSLAAAAAAAATSLFTVHARLFKEDIFLACFLVLVLAALIRLLQEPTQRRAILLGLLVGLAAGTKYVGVLILPFAVIAILLIPTQGQGQRWARAGTVAATSIVTFLLVMLPAIRRFGLWQSGVNSEFLHAMRGHDVPLPLRVTSGLFHLRESLLPGLGTPLFVLGLIGLAAPLVAARERRMPLLLIASFALLWYAVHETAPLKPFPDFSRYMLPLVPLLVILGDVLRLRAVVARRCSWGHRGDCRAARCHSCAVDVVADQLCRCRSALDRFVDRGGEWRARGVRSLRRLPGNARTPWVRLTSDQGPCGHRSHVELLTIASTSLSRAKALPPHFTAISSRSRILRFRMDGRPRGISIRCCGSWRWTDRWRGCKR